MPLPTLPADKAQHLIVNFIAIQAGASAGLVVGLTAPLSVGAGLALATALSLWKELIHDKAQRKGEASWRDMAANAVGMAIGLWPWALAGVFA